MTKWILFTKPQNMDYVPSNLSSKLTWDSFNCGGRVSELVGYGIARGEGWACTKRHFKPWILIDKVLITSINIFILSN